MLWERKSPLRISIIGTWTKLPEVLRTHFLPSLTPIRTLPAYSPEWIFLFDSLKCNFLLNHAQMHSPVSRVKWPRHRENWLHRVYWRIVTFSNLCFDNFLYHLMCNRGIIFCQFVTVELQISSPYTIWKGDALFWHASLIRKRGMTVHFLIHF